MRPFPSVVLLILGLVLANPRRTGDEALERGHEVVHQAALVALAPWKVARRKQAGEDPRALRLLDQEGIDLLECTFGHGDHLIGPLRVADGSFDRGDL